MLKAAIEAIDEQRYDSFMTHLVTGQCRFSWDGMTDSYDFIHTYWLQANADLRDSAHDYSDSGEERFEDALQRLILCRKYR